MSNAFMDELQRRIGLEVSKQVADYKPGQNLEFTIRLAMAKGVAILSNMNLEESTRAVEEIKKGAENG